jgi:hypothetical protein
MSDQPDFEVVFGYLRGDRKSKLIISGSEVLAAIALTGKAVPVKIVWRPFNTRGELERAANGSDHGAGDAENDVPEVKS